MRIAHPCTIPRLTERVIKVEKKYTIKDLHYINWDLGVTQDSECVKFKMFYRARLTKRDLYFGSNYG